ncbi:lysozyme family protein [Sediminibacillus albus]|uniref:Lysozyme-like n=1 Tax=Sediminibacillus albus TaxID=407036 RepID=A0A1G9AMK6_9BACI|nr:lysozyme family protein [Sediminibacillus albus]SDK28538.1 Lysozyme-like [Sediminibacillus albus]
MPKYKMFPKSSMRHRIVKSGMKTLAVIIGVITCFVVLFTAYQYQVSDNRDRTGDKQLSQQVLDYQPLLQKYLKKHGLEDYTGILLALMMQESGGRGTDPMQSSESYCGAIGCIDDPELSVKQGVAHFAHVLGQADGDVRLALQSYNFGPGFIRYVNERGGKYTEELAVDYSAKMYEKLKSSIEFRCIREESKELNACYGDIKYVDAVLAYYEDAKTVTDGDKVLIAMNES